MKSKFNTIFENIMNEFDPAMGDNLFEHLILVNVIEHLKLNFPTAEINVDKENITDVYCNVSFDKGTIYLLFDCDQGSVYLGCNELEYFDNLNITGVLQLFEDTIYDKMHKLKEALEKLK